MINKVGEIDGIPLYEDMYMEDNIFYKGRKGGEINHTFIIANPKTANILYTEFLNKLRKEKLEKLNKIK